MVSYKTRGDKLISVAIEGLLVQQNRLNLKTEVLEMNMLKKLNFYRKFSKSMRSIKTFFLLFGVLLSLAGCEKITPTMLPDTSLPTTEPLTVMTYNVYVGANMESLLRITNLVEVPGAVADVYAAFQATDFPGRAAGIASAIKANQPHIIGLQEISLIRTQSPGDRLTGGEPAEEVVLDFLKILMDALQAEGLNYQVAAKVQNFDVEMPMGSFTDYTDVRLTDFDVILVRDDVMVSRPTAVNYADILSIEALFIDILRGYVAVDATVAGVTYRVVNTHLESFTEENRVAQAQELLNSLGDETLPIILLGDFNTSAPDGPAYQMILSAGYVDVWQMDSQGTGNTCCQAKELQNEISEHRKRIDQIFVRNLDIPTTIMTHTVGDKPKDRLPSGLWPSDHAGVVAHLAFE